jgi:septum formation protein
MSKAGYAFDVRPADVDEQLPEECDDPAAEARRLAEEKARAVARAAPPEDAGRWVLGADTIVVLGRRLIGKPRDEADAERILGDLSGTEHQVTTGVALVQVGTDRHVVRHATTGIRMKAIGADEIRRYVQGGGSEGKAGAYAVQEGGDKYIERMDGSFTNVVGLPMELVDDMLRDIGWKGARKR